MFPTDKGSIYCRLCVLVLFLFLGDQHVLAQELDPDLVETGATQHFNSCTLLLPSGSTDDFVRLLQPIGDPTPVRVSIAFQIGEYEPCYFERVTPVELHFPQSSFSFRLEAKENESQYRFMLNKSGVGPVVWFAEMDTICVAVDEDWNYKIGCEDLGY
ncbi:MAG: hypothetical protein KTR29_17755 [Rhodothermaceae bacterium]|nr:hypothetical protein [Rhodothermaceae bacterium]